MLIVVEGPDGAGKSTLTRELAQELGDGTEILHRGPPTQHPLDEYETPLFDYRPGEGRHVVCDRWHVGEWVYPQVLRRKTQADGPAWRHIEMFLVARGAVTIFLMPKLDTLEERVGRDGDWLIEQSQLRDIRVCYEDAIDSLRFREYTLLDTDNRIRVDQIITTARAFERNAHDVTHAGSYVGPPRPNVLLVGERHDTVAPFRPAFGPYPSTCGHWMLKHLNFSTRYGLANAYEEDLRTLWVTLQKPPVVALGRRAHHELGDANVAHGSVPHPQFVRRFHHREGAWYDYIITRAAEGADLLRCRP